MNNKVVYIHRKKSDGEVFYVGLGREGRPFEMTKSRRTKLWWDIFQTHGVEVEILADDLSVEEAAELEKLVIREYGLENLINHTKGGETGAEGWKHTDATKLNISNAQKGKSSGMKGVKLSKEQKDALGIEVIVGDLTFSTMTEAAKAFGITKQAVSYRCNTDTFPDWDYVKKKFTELEDRLDALELDGKTGAERYIEFLNGKQ